MNLERTLVAGALAVLAVIVGDALLAMPGAELVELGLGITEGIIGAIFLDGGLAPAERMVQEQILRKYLEITTDQALHNYKGELLEYMQALGMGLPRYDVLEEKGPDQQKRFTIAVSVKGKNMGRGVGKNKKEAEQKAARRALENIDQLFKEPNK